MFFVIKLREKIGKSTQFKRDDVLDEDDEHHDGDEIYVVFFLSRFKDSDKLVIEKVESVKLMINRKPIFKY